MYLRSTVVKKERCVYTSLKRKYLITPERLGISYETLTFGTPKIVI